jgi:hypothetical protein
VSLSYLDLLLGTTIVFVVLYGLLHRQGELPAIEGKALALVIAVPQPKAKTSIPVTVKVTFVDGDTNESFSRQYGDTSSQVRFVSKRHPTLSVDFQYFNTESIVLLYGQPPPGLSFSIRAESTLSTGPENFVPRSLLELARRFPPDSALNAEQRQQLKWIEKGESLILNQSAMVPAMYQREHQNWLDEFPKSGGSIEFKREKFARQFFKLSDPDLEMRAELIVERSKNSQFSVDDWIKKMTEHQPESARRVIRSLKYRYGPNVTILLGNCAASREEFRELKDFNRSILGSERLAQRAGFQGGPSLFVDLVSENVAAPLSCTWSYAGAPGGATEHWKMENDKMTAEVLIDRFE